MPIRPWTVGAAGILDFPFRSTIVLVPLCLAVLLSGPASSEPAVQQQPSLPERSLTADELAALRQQAEAGDPVAQYDLGVAYANGQGVQQDYALSSSWYLRAADQGLARAQHALGRLYLNGQGIQRDRAEALKWFGIEEAGATGTEKQALGGVLGNVATTMTGAEVADAQKRAGQWAREFARRVPSARDLDLSTLLGLKGNDASTSASGAGRRLDGIEFPRLRKEVKPEYSKAAKARKIQGTVVLDCVVIADGKVGNCQVAQSLDKEFGLDEAAIKAARKWQFWPGKRNGVPVPVLVTIEINFTLMSK